MRSKDRDRQASTEFLVIMEAVDDERDPGLRQKVLDTNGRMTSSGVPVKLWTSE